MTPLFLSNMHTHTNLCDGKNTAAEIAAFAVENRFVSLGFSSHSPLPFENNYAMPAAVVAQYIKEIKQLKTEYAGKMEILLGLEWDLDSSLPQGNFDYLISSVHQLHPQNMVFAVDDTEAEFAQCLNEGYAGDLQRMLTDFYSKTVAGALRPQATIVGHFDLITKFNAQNAYFDPAAKPFRDIALAAVDAILAARPSMVFEVNTGALRRPGCLEPYPAAFVLRHLVQKQARVMLNSDAHAAQHLGFAFAQAIALCKQAGFQQVYRLRAGGFEAVAL